MRFTGHSKIVGFHGACFVSHLMALRIWRWLLDFWKNCGHHSGCVYEHIIYHVMLLGWKLFLCTLMIMNIICCSFHIIPGVTFPFLVVLQLTCHVDIGTWPWWWCCFFFSFFPPFAILLFVLCLVESIMLHTGGKNDFLGSLMLQDVVGVTFGGFLGHSLCTGLAVVGGRMIAQRISVRTGILPYDLYLQSLHLYFYRHCR
jgi:hypothetical protein